MYVCMCVYMYIQGISCRAFAAVYINMTYKKKSKTQKHEEGGWENHAPATNMDSRGEVSGSRTIAEARGSPLNPPPAPPPIPPHAPPPKTPPAPPPKPAPPLPPPFLSAAVCVAKGFCVC